MVKGQQAQTQNKLTESIWDAIVVGTGPSGAMVANELARNGKKVLILEKGNLDFTINIPKMLKHKEMMFMGKGRTLVRGIRTGGSSILYYGTAFDPPLDLFLQYGINLSEEIKELKQELPIAPLKDDLVGPAAAKIMETAVKLGYPWKKLNKFIYQDLCAPGQFPYEAQWNSVEFINKAVKLGATLRNGANVQHIVRDGDKALGVSFVANGEHHTEFASKIILAAGGIASAQILQASGLHRAGEGFFCDPLVLVHGTIDHVHAGNEIPMATGMIFENDGFVLTDITLPKIVYQLFSIQALKLNRVSHHGKTISIMVKIKDEIGGRINKSGKVYKDFTEYDKKKMNDGVLIAKEILLNAGAKNIFQTAWTAAHPGGSVRIGELVDANLKTEYDNLYVCDCSIIPTEWGLPPTYTLLALAKRLANYLKLII